MDLFPEEIKYANGLKLRADFNDNLPFGDDTFASLLCSEGIEHCPKQLELVREFHRVLKPGGNLVITTPNTLNFRARLASMLNGQSSFARNPISELTHVKKESKGGRLYIGHVFLISYFQLRFLLKITGFSNIRTSTAKYSMSATILAPIFWLPVFMATQKNFTSRIRKQDTEAVKEILAHVLSPDLLLGKKLIITAQKDMADKIN